MTTEQPLQRCPKELAIGSVLMVLLLILPVGWVFGYSLACSLGWGDILQRGMTHGYWVEGLSGPQVWQSLGYSLLLAGVVTGCSATVALLLVCGWPALRNQPGLLLLLLIPQSTPPGVLGFLILQILGRGGVLSRLGYWLGLVQGPRDFPVLVNDRWSVGLSLGLFCSTCPLLILFYVRSWRAARLDRCLQLARQLGATRWQAMRTIVMPLLVRRSPSLLLLCLLWNLAAWEVPLLLGVQSPRMLSVLIQQSSGQYSPEMRPLAFVYATVYLGLVTFLAAGFAFRRFRRG